MRFWLGRVAEATACGVIAFGAGLTCAIAQPETSGGFDFASIRSQSAISASFDFTPLPFNAGKGITIALLSGGPSPAVAATMGRRVTCVSVRTDDASVFARADDSASFSNTMLTIVGALAPAAHIVNVKILDKDQNSAIDIVAAGIARAVALKARIIIIPVGQADPAPAVASAINKALKAGILVVASAGDEGAGAPSRFPANMNGVLSIGAVDAENAIARFSSTGAAELYAPGVDIAGLNESGASETTSGTSHAAAVAGAILADLWSQKVGLKASRLAAAVRASARRIPDGQGGTASLIDASAALRAIKTAK